ncbi:MAG TPA: hypothetical protein PLE24_03860 [Chitinispirillaceae bacterium]|nr:hypothetical protein [Chitinispirillaceae bacterium]
MRVLPIIAVLILSVQAENPYILQFSDESKYNAAEHAGSPLGWLESESTMVNADLSMYLYRLSNKVFDINYIARNFAAPHIRLSNPGTIVFDFFYRPEIAIQKGSGTDTRIPLARFGLGLAGGTANGIFQAGIKADMFVGKQAPTGIPDRRLVLGSDEVSIHLGSRFHELIGIGFFAGAKGYIDSLQSQDPENYQDRFFSGAFPLLGGFIDAGKSGFPLRSNFSLGWGINRFVYTYKNSANSLDLPTIQGDSIRLNWITMYDIEKGGLKISPALKMEYWRSNPKFYEPGSDNYPWQKGNNMSGSGLELSSFGLGMGLSFDILKYVNFNLEYGFKNVSSKCDSVFPLIEDNKEWYHSTVVDLQCNIHKIPALRIPESMELIINAGFFNSLYNAAFDYWQTEFVHLVPPTVSSQSWRYDDPYPVFLNSRVIGFNAGIRTSFLDRMFGVGAEFIYFTENDKEEKGPGFSIDLSYNLQKPQDQGK